MLKEADVGAGKATLIAIHKACVRVTARFYSEIASYETINGLQELAKRRGREWAAWTKAVIAGIEQCQPPLLDLNRAVQEAWAELAG